MKSSLLRKLGMLLDDPKYLNFNRKHCIVILLMYLLLFTKDHVYDTNPTGPKDL